MTDPRAIEWAFLPARATLVSFAIATTAAQAMTDAANITHEDGDDYRYLQVQDQHAIAEVTPEADGADGAWIATEDDELIIDAERNR